MPRRSIKLTQQERIELVLRLLRREASATALAREAEVSEATLYQWRDKFVATGGQSLAPGKAGQSDVARLEKELVEHRRIIGELTVANTVLKKSLGISS